VAAVVTFEVAAPHAFSQAPNPAGANARKFGVAVVDVGYIFKNHQRFRSTMEAMKTELEGIEQGLKTKREAIAQKEQQRQEYNIGSAEYKKLDEELAREKANFNVEMTQLRKEFMEREAKVYYQTYLEVDSTVKYYAERNEIGLVLRFNGEEPDPNQPRQVLESINKQVVYQNSIDITPDILALLNRSERTATQPAAQQSQIPAARR
jgi:Skp family chaperone for outer membrane proteins